MALGVNTVASGLGSAAVGNGAQGTFRLCMCMDVCGTPQYIAFSTAVLSPCTRYQRPHKRVSPLATAWWRPVNRVPVSATERKVEQVDGAWGTPRDDAFSHHCDSSMRTIPATANYVIAAGFNAQASAALATALGVNSVADSQSSVAVGDGADTNGYGAIVLNGVSGGLAASAAGFFVAPVRSVGSGTANLVYDAANKVRLFGVDSSYV